MSDNDRPEPGKSQGSGNKNATPSAGPHARPDLTNPDATPGAGSLPDDKAGGDTDAGTG